MLMIPYPEHWIPGTLLDLRRFNDGSFKATIMGEEPKLDESNVLAFDSGHAAQQFVSIWYAPAAIRDQVID